MEDAGNVVYKLSTMKLTSQSEFDQDAQELIEMLNNKFIKEINQAIILGKIHLSLRKDIVARLSVAIHCFESTVLDLLNV